MPVADSEFTGIIMRLLSRVRPQPESDVSTGTLLGWYLRKGALPVLRGTASWFRFGSVKWPLFIGPGAAISYARNIRIGSSCSIGARSVINAFGKNAITLGDHVTIRENAWIQCASHPSNPGEGLRIGSKTYIGPSVTIGVGGPIVIGEKCQFGADVVLIAENHAISVDGRPSNVNVTREGITIGSNCWIGHRVTILDGVAVS